MTIPYDKKIEALQYLVKKGFLTDHEFQNLAECLKTLAGSQETFPSSSPALSTIPPPVVPDTPQEKYSQYIKTVVSKKCKCPGSVSFPPLDSSMVRRGCLSVRKKLTSPFGVWRFLLRSQHHHLFESINCQYIRTYIDAMNLRGAPRRSEICIVVDDSLTPQFWVERLDGTIDQWFMWGPEFQQVGK